jgi:hypothetical protein
MNKGFQHFVESKSIQMMMKRMQTTQFVSIVDWIQMKVRKVIHTTRNTMNKECQH